MTPQLRIGLASLTRMAFEGKNLAHLCSQLLVENARNPNSVGCLMDISVIQQLNGNLKAGLDYQLQAFKSSRLFRTRREAPSKKTLLVLAAPIHMGGNTPVEFLLENSEFEIITYYVVPGMEDMQSIPEHDVAFVAAPGDSGITRQFIEEIDRLTIAWPVPLANKPQKIMKLERDELQQQVRNIAKIRYPKTIRCNREELNSISASAAPSDQFEEVGDYPIVIRPVGSHAGRGLEKLTCPADLDRYLQIWFDEEFFVSEYIDYSSPKDGAFRKYRIIFIDGKAYPCHMAISDQWKIWYMNAEMQHSEEKRLEEKAFMDSFNVNFAEKHKSNFSSLCQNVGLDYFGIDCAEDQNGNLVLFEADNALIVHNMDSRQIFPYKERHMDALFEAFSDMLNRKSERVGEPGLLPRHPHGFMTPEDLPVSEHVRSERRTRS